LKKAARTKPKLGRRRTETRQTQNRNSADAEPKLGRRRTEARQTQNRSSANAEPKLGKRRTEARQTQNRNSATQNRQLGKRKTDNSANAKPKRKGSSLKKMLPTNALPKIVANLTHKAERAA